MNVPRPDPLQPASFGSVELRERKDTEFIGQPLSYAPGDCVPVPVRSIDSLRLSRLDLIKADVEGMELEVLEGARATIERHRPIVLVEVVKSDKTQLRELLAGSGYKVFAVGMNFLAVHEFDPVAAGLVQEGDKLSLNW